MKNKLTKTGLNKQEILEDDTKLKKMGVTELKQRELSRNEIKRKIKRKQNGKNGKHLKVAGKTTKLMEIS